MTRIDVSVKLLEVINNNKGKEQAVAPLSLLKELFEKLDFLRKENLALKVSSEAFEKGYSQGQNERDYLAIRNTELTSELLVLKRELRTLKGLPLEDVF